MGPLIFAVHSVYAGAAGKSMHAHRGCKMSEVGVVRPSSQGEHHGIFFHWQNKEELRILGNLESHSTSRGLESMQQNKPKCVGVRACDYKHTHIVSKWHACVAR